MRDAAALCVSADTTIARAIEIIDAQAVQIALVVNEQSQLIGTVTDGDVRRAILARSPLDAVIATVMNASPSSVPVGTSQADILELMKARHIHQVPVVGEGGEVVGIEILDDLLRSPSLSERGKVGAASFRDEVLPSPTDKHWVVLLAGGRGRRLGPLTEDVPKPMLEVGSQPILESILCGLRDHGYKRFFLSVNYRAEVIEEYFGDGSAFGVQIDYLREDRPLGTAGSLSLLPERPQAPVLVMNGDLLTALNPRQLLAFHQKQGADATMCVREYDFQVPFGVVSIEGSQLRSIDEKPVHKFFVNAGIYLLGPEVLKRLKPDEAKNMTTVFEELVADGGSAAVCPVREYWLDIGRMPDLDRAREDVAEVLGT